MCVTTGKAGVPADATGDHDGALFELRPDAAGVPEYLSRVMV